MGAMTLLADLGVAASRAGGGGLWVRSAGFGWCRDKAPWASALAGSAMMVMAAVLVMAGGRRGGRCCCRVLGRRGWRLQRTSVGGCAWAADLAPGLDLGLCLAVRCGCGVALNLGSCFTLGLGGGWTLGCGLAAGLGFGWAAAAGFAAVRCLPALPVAGRGAAWVLADVGSLGDGTGFGACVGDVALGQGGGLLGEVVVVEVDELVVVVEVGESGREALVEEVEGEDRQDAEGAEMDWGDAGARFSSLAAIGVRWARSVSVRVRTSGVCTHFPWCPVCMQVPLLWAVSFMVCDGVVESYSMRGLVSYSVGGPG